MTNETDIIEIDSGRNNLSCQIFGHKNEYVKNDFRVEILDNYYARYTRTIQCQRCDKTFQVKEVALI